MVRATGISESTVLRGLADLDSEERPSPGRVRRHPGRTPILEREPGLAEDLERLVDPVTRGDPESPLRWTSKSGAKLAEALREMGHEVVERTVLRLLKAKGYSLQANKKAREGSQHPDRDAQFQHISETVSEALAAGEPVISVDAKKRELIGDFKAVGREFQPKGRPVEVRGHDFKDKQLGMRSHTASTTCDRRGMVSSDHERHRSVRREHDHQLWSTSAKTATRRRHVDDHRRFRRVQQSPHPALASRAATHRRHDRATDPRLPLPAAPRSEQDRAPHVQLRQPQLRANHSRASRSSSTYRRTTPTPPKSTPPHKSYSEHHYHTTPPQHHPHTFHH